MPNKKKKVKTCIVIREKSAKKAMQKMKIAQRLGDIVEVRLDYLKDPENLKLKSSKPILIVNRRSKDGGKWVGKESTRINEIKKLIPQADMIDIELNVKIKKLNEVLSLAKKNRTKVIISYHNTKTTPPMKKLVTLFNVANIKADFVKIATHVKSFDHNLRIFDLINYSKGRGKIIAVGMGPLGKITRVLGPIIGNSHTYATLEESDMISVSELKSCLNAL